MAKQPIKIAKTKAKKEKLLKVFVKPGKELHVLEIEDETNNITTALGITPERAKELEDKVKTALNSSDNIVHIIVPLSKECKHANELYFVSMMMTEIVVKMRNPFRAMVFSIGKAPNSGKEE